MRRLLDWTAQAGAGAGAGAQLSVNSKSTSSQQQASSLATGNLSAGAHSAANELELQHLAKLLHEIKYYQTSSSPLPSVVGSQSQRELVAKINKALPLFLDVFSTSSVQHVPTSHSHHQQADSSSSQLSLLTDEWSQSGSCPSSKPSSPLPPNSPQLEKFPDILPFAFTIARLFVSEVRQRASDKHAEEASIAILEFLSESSAGIEDKTQATQTQTPLEPTGSFRQGWSLLLALNTLASSQSSQIIQLLCDASLPSTLIKCLYLFFDLPPRSRQPQSRSAEYQDQLTPTDEIVHNEQPNSLALTKAFTQLLVHLCSYQTAIDELIRKDDLRLLVGIASSQCATQNRSWRKSAFLALLAISKNMRENFIYLEQNACIRVYVENMHRINSLGQASTEDFIDIIRVLLEFLYNIDVNNRNQPHYIVPLIEQFKTSRITDLIEELLFTLDDNILQESKITSNPSATDADPLMCSASQQPSVSSEVGVCIDDYRRYGKRLVHSCITMAKIYLDQDGLQRNTTLKPLAMSRFEMLEQFKMPKPSSRDCILNNEALKLFKMGWSKCRDPYIIEAILDSTIALFNDDKYNYFIFESQQLLVYYMTNVNFNQLPCKLKQKFFKFLEFIIIETNYIPCLELGTLGTIIKSTNTSDVDQIMILRTFIACLRFNAKFSDIFREMGILEVIVVLLTETMQDEKLGQMSEKIEVLYLLLEASQYLLAGPNNLNCTQFNESGASRHVFNCLSKPKFFHLFVPPHSSSSDDGGTMSNTSRNSTPTPTSISKIRHNITTIHATNQQWLEPQINRCHPRPSIKQTQKVAFTIIRQLILSSAGDEHLANLLGLLARNLDDLKSIERQDDKNNESGEVLQGSSPKQFDLAYLISQEVNLKIYILKSLMIILKDSHRCRTLFRKVGGFIYIVSALVTLEHALPLYEQNEIHNESHERWRNVNYRRIWRLIKSSLMTLIVAMRSEPLNLRVFADEIMPRFVEALRRIGCFNVKQTALRPHARLPPRTDHFEIFKSIFLSPPARDFSTIAEESMQPSEACCQLFRFLYDMSLDMADGTNELERQLNDESGRMFKGHTVGDGDAKSMSFDQGTSDHVNYASGIYKRRSQLQKASARPPSLDLNICNVEPAILTFPCTILCIMDLIPSCPNEDLMIFACMIIKSLFKHERNQQLLCEAGMITKLLEPSWQISITDKNHFLHNLSKYMFEKLTKQAITPKELRMFLRLGEPLCCKNLDEIKVDTEQSNEMGQREADTDKRKEKISSSRIETFAAMMSDERAATQPPFVEFDMSNEGCLSIFMPSIAPVNAKSLPPNSSSFLNSTLDVHTNEKNGILGGVGPLERHFPPLTGLTFSTWICVDKFPSRSPDANHNIRLLTIYRGSAATGKEYSCLRIQISALDRALTISTQETLLFDNEIRPDAQHDPDCFVRIWTPETLFEGRWHHIAVTMNKSNAKQSTIQLYVDGVQIHSQRICYITNHVGNLVYMGPNTTLAPAAFVNAFIGSLPQIRYQSKTRWKQGPCHLIEEPLNASVIMTLHALGPNYIGNFQGSRGIKESSKARTHRNVESRYSSVGYDSTRQVQQQQSVASAMSPRHGLPLTRVSSSSVGTSSSALAFGQHQSNQQYMQLGEDRMLMNIDARSTSLITLTRMRRIYTRFDCRQVSRFLGLAMHENSTPLLLLHNTAVHLNGASRGIGAITIGYDHVRCFIPNPTEQTLFSIGGSYVLIGLVAQSESVAALYMSLKTLVCALSCNSKLQAQMDSINGYQLLTVMLWRKKHLLDRDILKLIFSLIKNDYKLSAQPSTFQTRAEEINSVPTIHQVSALRDLVCECFDLWLQTDMINLVLEFIHDLISSTGEMHQSGESATTNTARTRNLKYLRDMDLLPRMLRLLPREPKAPVAEANKESDVTNKSDTKSTHTFDAKAVYLIKQTVFELLNRTPRQSDILYFGQYLASLLPSEKTERLPQTISLRNVLLKSLLQMMTRNKQKEVNNAMQEELVRILGFDWFMLFINDSFLDSETITIGFLNLMIVLSNDELYQSFKNRTHANGGWLKEPVFPTIDGRSNIQLLGINVGVFFGLNGKRKAMCQNALEASNFFILGSCLANLRKIPRIYLMIFQTMMSRLIQLDSDVFDTIGSFENLNLDVLCDRLIGETHHKRRQTLAGVQFRSLELIVSLVYMIRDIMCDYREPEETEVKEEKTDQLEGAVDNFPTDIIRFFMYLYNNNHEFQNYCRYSEELVDALCEVLMLDPSPKTCKNETASRFMTSHPASKQCLELSRLIILDRMTEVVEGQEITSDQLHTFERFLDSLSACKEAQSELVDMLLRQILLMIDSTARHNSIKTIGVSENIQQFQMLLVNSITIAHTVTDKIWSLELHLNNLARVSAVIDNFLCLAEQTFKFNEILPKHSPPYAFLMQRALNRIILFALSRQMQHVSDKMLMLDLLKKIYDNRTIIILNHMHSPNSAEFFVCLTYCLLKIIEENITTPVKRTTNSQQSIVASDHSASLIERQFGHPSPTRSHNDTPSSSALMLVSMARKVWDAVYQSKKGILSEAFDISLSLPAFTLDTSLDLIQLKPDIIDSCEKYWSNLIEAESKPKRRIQTKTSEPAHGTASAAVNILSGRLTRVVNAANFVSRVVGATAGTMASNVNLVGEKFTQTNRQMMPQRSPSDLSASSLQSSRSSENNQGSVGNIHQATAGANLNQVASPNTNTCLFKQPGLSHKQILQANLTHVSIIEDYIRSQTSQKDHKLALHKYLCDEWLDLEYEILLRERALFGPDYGSELDKWCLDMTEGPRRMRKKMVNNTRQFFENYAYHPEQFNPSNKSLRYRPPMSYDSHLYYLKMLQIDRCLLETSDIKVVVSEETQAKAEIVSKKVPTSKDEDDGTKDLRESSGTPTNNNGQHLERMPAHDVNSPSPTKSAKEIHTSSLESLSAPDRRNSIGGSPKPSDGDADDGESTSFVDFSPEIEAETNSARESENIDSLSVLRLLEKNERISHMFRCSRVQGLDTYEGLLLFGREHFYLIDGFTLLKTREIKDIDGLPPEAHDPIIPNSTPNILAHSKKTCAKFAFDSVVEVHKRRYLLQPIALEVFSSDGRNTLIVFPRNIRNKVYSRLMQVATQITSNAHESLAGQKSNVSVEGGSGLLSNLMGETSVTQRWVRGELSNFQYLMNLNTIAGRSYNDLMQYPIFPWILADYTSDFLDLTKSSTFRDLSRPVGAQTSDRLDQFKRRYAEWDDTETPPYHYGTFYSSAMIVASYMVRMEPFSQHFLRLQGGHFDLADRMFHSINDSWMSASKHNMADIKELIPEFFYLPEFLKNDNKYDLGIKQNGMRLDNVILPPWAKGDAREFIRLHRCALESDYVSAHLHEWIDLIFGYKQQGQPAVDSVNVFHHLFYEGNVDIYNTDIDPIKKNAVIGFINNFGQVPKQLFKKPHPVRKVTSSNYISSGSTSMPLTPILPTLSSSSNFNATQRILTHCPQSLRPTNASIKDLRGPVGQIVQVDKNVVAVEQNKLLIPPEYCRYIAWGHADRSLRLGLYDSEKPIYVWEGSDILQPNEILCCTIPNNRTMITAGTESLITVWKIEKMRSFTPMMNLYGHVEPITCLASSQPYSVFISGSRDRTAIIWDLNRFTFVRQLGGGPSDKLVHQGPISAIAINDSTGDIATCATSWLYLWTINGELLSRVDSFNVAIQQSSGLNSSVSGNPTQLHILSVCFSQFNDWDLDEVIVTGASDGSVILWSMRYFQVPMSRAELEAREEAAREQLKLANETLGLTKHESSASPPVPVDESSASREAESEHNRDEQNLVPDEENGDNSFRDQENAISSMPIAIKGRQRTDTMNTEWVKLSISTLGTTPNLNDAQSPGEPFNSSDFVASGDSFSYDKDQYLIDKTFKDQSQGVTNVEDDTQPRCSTSIPPPTTTAQDASELEKSHTTSASRERKDRTSTSNLSNNGDEVDGQSMSKANLFLVPNDPSLIKFSKSDTSLVDSFVLLGDASPTGQGNQNISSPNRAGEGLIRVRPQSSAGTHVTAGQPKSARRRLGSYNRHDDKLRTSMKLQPNHRWSRELYMRMVLPRRQGKTAPAAVTSLTISKDHRTLYVGDASGRVGSWTTQ